MTTTTGSPDQITLLGIECEVSTDHTGVTVYESDDEDKTEVHLWVMHTERKRKDDTIRRRWRGELSISIPGSTWPADLWSLDEPKVPSFETLEELEAYLLHVIGEYRRILDGLST